MVQINEKLIQAHTIFPSSKYLSLQTHPLALSLVAISEHSVHAYLPVEHLEHK